MNFAKAPKTHRESRFVGFERLERRDLLAAVNFQFEGVVDQVMGGALIGAQSVAELGDSVFGRISVDPDNDSIIGIDLNFNGKVFPCPEFESDFFKEGEVFIVAECVNLPDVHLNLGWDGTKFSPDNAYVGQETEVDCAVANEPFCYPDVQNITVEADITSIGELEIELGTKGFESNGAVFGPYLLGVELNETFEIEMAEGVAPFVERVTAKVDSFQSNPTVTKSGSNTWSFQADIGQFEEDTNVSFTVQWNDGTEQTVEGTIDIQETSTIEDDPLQGDTNGDGVRTSADLDLLSAAIRRQESDPRFDVNDDGAVNAEDHRFFIKEIEKTFIGDANLDGIFDSKDLVAIFGAGGFERDIDALWSEGDWNGDGRFDTSDLVAAFGDGGYLD